MTDSEQQEIPSYTKAKRQFKSAMELMLDAGHSFGEFTEFILTRYGDQIQPYLQQFTNDLRNGRIKIKGLTKSALEAIRGPRISAEQRQAMIREAAYYHAEHRGFLGDSADEDWRIAEQEIDAMLAQEEDVFGKRRKQLNAAIETVEERLGNLTQAIANWIEASRTGSTEGEAAAMEPAKRAEHHTEAAPTKAKKSAPKRKATVKGTSGKVKSAKAATTTKRTSK
jgi:hypothetical protein